MTRARFVWVLLLGAACGVRSGREACDLVDNDGDDLVDEGFDGDGDGYYACAADAARVDCDDHFADVFPGAPEVCNGRDDDCDGLLPDHEADLDMDGLMTCAGDCDDADAFANASDWDADGYTSCDVEPDCDDFDPGVSPAESKDDRCDGVDTDCDGLLPADELDADGDGQMGCEGDCDDSDPARNAIDADGDRHTTCGAGDDYDCDDGDGRVYAGADDAICDGIWADCGGLRRVPDNEQDLDGDGEWACEGDCDDDDPTRYAAAAEACDGIDNDCNLVVPVDEQDLDGDGERACDGDCDDDDAAVTSADWDLDGYSPCGAEPDCDDRRADINPGVAEESCNGLDDNCDGGVGLEELDGDGDGHVSCEDCDTGNPDAWDRAAAELCDLADNNCDGLLDPSEVDEDNDGQYACALPGYDFYDCNDTTTSIVFGAKYDTCDDDVDSDCDGGDDTYTLYVDADRDGFGTTPSANALACEQAEPGCSAAYCWVEYPGDCDDGDAYAYPGAVDICGNGVDEDCDGTVDDHC